MSILSIFISFTSVNATESDVIKDPILKHALLNLDYPDKLDTNNDGKISAEEAEVFCGSCDEEARIDLTGYGFESLEGMEYFDNIKQFYFGNNNVSDITPLLGM